MVADCHQGPREFSEAGVLREPMAIRVCAHDRIQDEPSGSCEQGEAGEEIGDYASLESRGTGNPGAGSSAVCNGVSSVMLYSCHGYNVSLTVVLTM